MAISLSCKLNAHDGPSGCVGEFYLASIFGPVTICECVCHIEDDVCGVTFDHVESITFEDEEIIQWECRTCGAKGWEYR